MINTMDLEAVSILAQEGAYTRGREGATRPVQEAEFTLAPGEDVTLDPAVDSTQVRAEAFIRVQEGAFTPDRAAASTLVQEEAFIMVQAEECTWGLAIALI